MIHFREFLVNICGNPGVDFEAGSCVTAKIYI